jgi:hypothetical protein
LSFIFNPFVGWQAPRVKGTLFENKQDQSMSSISTKNSALRPSPAKTLSIRNPAPKMYTTGQELIKSIGRFRHKSTTRPERNINKIRLMADAISKRHITNPAILEIGPGMAIRYLGRLSRIKKPFELFRRIEVGLRAVLPLPHQAYEIYETAEILSIFGSLPSVDASLSLLDFDETILATARCQFSNSLCDLILADLSLSANEHLTSLHGKYDAIFVTAVIKRISTAEGRMNAARNIVAMAKPGAILTNSAPELIEAGCIADPTHPGLCLAPK